MTTPEFWIFISKMKNGVGQLCCPVLSKFCLDLLALPHSSAAVEKTFSFVNDVKSKKRNKLDTSTVKGHLLAKTICVKKWRHQMVTFQSVMT